MRTLLAIGICGVLAASVTAYADQPTTITELMESGAWVPGPPQPPGRMDPQTDGPGQVTFFDDRDEFLAALPLAKTSKGVETFEESVPGPGFPAPLCSGIPNPPNFPDGLTGLYNLCVDTELVGLLFVIPVASTAVGPSVAIDNGLLRFNQSPLGDGPAKTAVGFDLYLAAGSGNGTATVEVQDETGTVIGSMVYTGLSVTPTFVGVIADPGATIGTIRTVAPSEGAEAFDNIEAYLVDVSQIPTVSEWGLIVMGLLMLTAGTIVIRREMGRAVAA